MIGDLKGPGAKVNPTERSSGKVFYDLLNKPNLSMEDLTKALQAGSISSKEYDTLSQALMEKLRLL